MGIKHFFMWYKKNMSNNMKSLSEDETLRSKNVKIDNLLLDLNGVFHGSAQKIFKYGSHAPPKRLLHKKQSVEIPNNQETRDQLYEDVCVTISNIVSVVEPSKRLIMCIDGPAPLGKQNQQRQRRFRAANDSTRGVFDSNCITPGTEFMHELGVYLDAFIVREKQINPKWKDIDIVFSNEKVPGEGEHKAVEFVRKHGTDDETYCINGPDADLFMLALATHKENFYILREDMYDKRNAFFCVDIAKTRTDLIDKMRWESPDKSIVYNTEYAINDFVFMCFTVGNDFLPHVPSIEIIEEGIEMMIDIYRSVGMQMGHMTTKDSKGRITFDKNVLKLFFSIIAEYEGENFKRKLGNRSFFPDKMMLNYSHRDPDGGWYINTSKYINEYNNIHFGDKTESACHQYLQGLQWVITYYTTGCPSWKWYYPYQYAPMASLLSEHIDTYVPVRYGTTKPSLPFQQLLSVLPPKSSHLIPEPLSKALTDPLSPMIKFCPTELKIDLAGKRKEWEGITILPMVDQQLVKRICKKYPVESHLNTVESEKYY
jgi:5'-3' exonuclease